MFPELNASQIEVAAIGNGTVLMAQDFKESFDVPFPLFTDPSRKSYKWMNLKSNVASSLSLKMIRRGFDASRSGHRQGKTQGNALQQGGEALFDTNGRAVWRYVSQSPGDHASPEQIREAVLRFKTQTTVKL
ncbi:MAG: peroxiredoxin-like family protein [Myxococcota bacterium]|nr:peroxiredoxin-like family protein [Myxococcota bacterium]